MTNVIDVYHFWDIKLIESINCSPSWVFDVEGISSTGVNLLENYHIGSSSEEEIEEISESDNYESCTEPDTSQCNDCTEFCTCNNLNVITSDNPDDLLIQITDYIDDPIKQAACMRQIINHRLKNKNETFHEPREYYNIQKILQENTPRSPTIADLQKEISNIKIQIKNLEYLLRNYNHL